MGLINMHSHHHQAPAGQRQPPPRINEILQTAKKKKPLNSETETLLMFSKGNWNVFSIPSTPPLDQRLLGYHTSLPTLPRPPLPLLPFTPATTPYSDVHCSFHSCSNHFTCWRPYHVSLAQFSTISAGHCHYTSIISLLALSFNLCNTSPPIFSFTFFIFPFKKSLPSYLSHPHISQYSLRLLHTETFLNLPISLIYHLPYPPFTTACQFFSQRVLEAIWTHVLCLASLVFSSCSVHSSAMLPSWKLDPSVTSTRADPPGLPQTITRSPVHQLTLTCITFPIIVIHDIMFLYNHASVHSSLPSSFVSSHFFN